MEFKKALTIESKGLEKFLKTIDGFCRIKNWNKTNLTDVSYSSEYQKRDVDYILSINECNMDIEMLIEIKSTTYNYGKIFVECVSNSNKNSDGYIFKTESDYLVYTFENNKIIYLNTNELRKWFIDNQMNYPKTTASTTNSDNKILYYSEGRVIPISDIKINDKIIFDLSLN